MAPGATLRTGKDGANLPSGTETPANGPPGERRRVSCTSESAPLPAPRAHAWKDARVRCQRTLVGLGVRAKLPSSEALTAQDARCTPAWRPGWDKGHSGSFCGSLAVPPGPPKS